MVVEDIRGGGGTPYADASRQSAEINSFPVIPPRRPGQLFDAVLTAGPLVTGAMRYLQDCDAAIGPVLIDGPLEASETTAMWLVLPGALSWLRRQARPGLGPVLAVYAECEVPRLPPREGRPGSGELRWLHLPRMIGTWTSPVLLLGALGMAVLRPGRGR